MKRVILVIALCLCIPSAAFALPEIPDAADPAGASPAVVGAIGSAFVVSFTGHGLVSLVLDAILSAFRS